MSQKKLQSTDGVVVNEFSGVTVVGGGLSGSEAAWQLAQRGHRVKLLEMRPEATTRAHKTAFLGELVCSNSLKSVNLNNASGILKKEMEVGGSLILQAAVATQVAAGSALAVDRDAMGEWGHPKGGEPPSHRAGAYAGERAPFPARHHRHRPTH